jgi:WD40 repeat protein
MTTTATPLHASRVFVSYRREDAAYPAGWLFDRLVDHFGEGRVFRDVDSIELGDDFVERIMSAVGSCAVLLTVIGARWLTVTGKGGQRRLDDPEDFVRVEIEAAFARGVRVIPVLVDGAQMPQVTELPVSLGSLAHRQALELSPNRFRLDTAQLLEELDRKLAVLDPGFSDPDGVIAAARERSQGQAHPRVGGESMLASEKMLLHTIPIVKHAGYLTFSRDGRTLAVGSGTTVQLIDVTRGETRITLVHPEFAIRGVAFSPDGHRLAIGSSDGAAIICNAATGSRGLKIRANRSGAQLQDLAFSPDGRLLATASEDTTAQVWTATSGRRLQTLTHDGVVYDLAFSPDGRLLATASFDGTARVWEAASGRQLLTLAHVREVYGIAFSPDGQLLATGCRDKSARVWDVASGRKVLAVTHGDAVLGVAFSPEGLLATASADRTARVWDSATGGQLLTLPHDGIVDRAVFSPDGSQLATVTRHKCAQAWQLAEVHDG